MPKKNLTIRIEDEMREKIQLIADREIRPLANQMLYFLTQGVDSYLNENGLTYVPEAGQLMTMDELRKWKSSKNSEKPPF